MSSMRSISWKHSPFVRFAPLRPLRETKKVQKVGSIPYKKNFVSLRLRALVTKNAASISSSRSFVKKFVFQISHSASSTKTNLIIMKPALYYVAFLTCQLFSFNFIHKPMFTCYSSRPIPF